MATNTTNFGLKKPAYSDTADIADINGNMDKVDVSLNGLADAIAIVANNNTHAAITAGQYVYVHGHSTLAEGLYTAKSNIAANATLSTSNLQADGSGGLNALNSKIQYFTTNLVYLDQLTWTRASSASPYVATVVPSSDISGTLISATIFRMSSWLKETTSLTITMYDNQIALAIDDTSHLTSSSRVSIRYVVMN